VQKRRSFGGQFNARVVLKVLTGIKSTAQVCHEHVIKETLLSCWRQEFMELSTELFERRCGHNAQDEHIVAPMELVKFVTSTLHHVYRRESLVRSFTPGMTAKRRRHVTLWFTTMAHEVVRVVCGG
jgi:hypothetical protein